MFKILCVTMLFSSLIAYRVPINDYSKDEFSKTSEYFNNISNHNNNHFNLLTTDMNSKIMNNFTKIFDENFNISLIPNEKEKKIKQIFYSIMEQQSILIITSNTSRAYVYNSPNYYLHINQYNTKHVFIGKKFRISHIENNEMCHCQILTIECVTGKTPISIKLVLYPFNRFSIGIDRCLENYSSILMQPNMVYLRNVNEKKNFQLNYDLVELELYVLESINPYYDPNSF